MAAEDAQAIGAAILRRVCAVRREAATEVGGRVGRHAEPAAVEIGMLEAGDVSARHRLLGAEFGLRRGSSPRIGLADGDAIIRHSAIDVFRRLAVAAGAKRERGHGQHYGSNVFHIAALSTGTGLCESRTTNEARGATKMWKGACQGHAAFAPLRACSAPILTQRIARGNSIRIAKRRPQRRGATAPAALKAKT
jgi:hypothetical protein